MRVSFKCNGWCTLWINYLCLVVLQTIFWEAFCRLQSIIPERRKKEKKEMSSGQYKILSIDLWLVQLTGAYSTAVCWSSLIVLCLPGNRFRRKHGQILIACAWTYAAIFACSPLAHWGEYGEEPYGTACCIDWQSTNVEVMSMSYTVVLFVFCFVLPCGVILTSYSLILVTVKESRRAVEQHVSGPTRINNVQTITVKVSKS